MIRLIFSSIVISILLLSCGSNQSYKDYKTPNDFQTFSNEVNEVIKSKDYQKIEAYWVLSEDLHAELNDSILPWNETSLSWEKTVKKLNTYIDEITQSKEQLIKFLELIDGNINDSRVGTKSKTIKREKNTHKGKREVEIGSLYISLTLNNDSKESTIKFRAQKFERGWLITEIERFDLLQDWIQGKYTP